MERLSVFYPAKNDAGYVQAVIVGDDLPVYQALGFVTSVNDLQPVEDDKPADDSDKSKTGADPEDKTTGNKANKTKAGADGSDSDKG